MHMLPVAYCTMCPFKMHCTSAVIHNSLSHDDHLTPKTSTRNRAVMPRGPTCATLVRKRRARECNPLGVVMFWHNRHCAVGQPL
jgi:hypothetical protein